MKKKWITLLLIVAVALFFTACGSGKKDTSNDKKGSTTVTTDKGSDSKTASDGSDSQKTDSGQDTQKKTDSGTSSGSSKDTSDTSGKSSGSSTGSTDSDGSASGSSKDSSGSSGSSGSGDSTKQSSTGSGGEEDVEPGNADPTGSVAKDKTADEMESLYVGTWTIKGILLSDGSIDSEGVSGKYEIKSNGEYTADVTYADGSTDKGSGKWSVNSDKKLVAGSSEMGLDSSSRLLKYSGERDGKGNRLYYAFVKGK